MADGGRGSGLLECWHVPIRATVLHYSISATQHSGTVLIVGTVSVQTLLKCPEHYLQAASALYWTIHSITPVRLILRAKGKIGRENSNVVWNI